MHWILWAIVGAAAIFVLSYVSAVIVVALSDREYRISRVELESAVREQGRRDGRLGSRSDGQDREAD